MKLILHIGMQKTGTSAIQYFLNQNRNRLLKDNILYPSLQDFSEIRFSGVSYHNCVAASLIGRPSAFPAMTERNLAALRRLIEDSTHPVLLSAEDFSRALDMEAISRFTAGLDVSVIVYLREQAEWAQSMYNQRNKILFDRADDRLLGSDVLTAEDLFMFLRQEKYTPLMKYDALLERWETLSSDVYVRLFSKNQYNGENIIEDFMNTIGISNLSGYKMPPRVNDNLANDWISLARETAEAQGVEAAKGFMRRLTKAAQDGNISLSGKTNILEDRIVKKMRSDYQEMNRSVARKYFGRDNLFSE